MSRRPIEPEIVDEDDGAHSPVEAMEPVPLPNDPVHTNLPIRRLTLPALSGDQLLSDDPLTTYLAQLRHIAPLSAEEQQTLAERYHGDQDVEAAQQLVMSNLRLVVKIAREYHRRRTNLMELVQEGNVGLAEAIRRYDPYRGVKFTSYAQYWIRAMILNYLMNVMQLVRVGSTRSGRKLFYNLQKARDQLVRQGYLNPTSRQLADHLGVKESEVVDVARILDAPTLSLDAPAPGHEGGSLESVIPDEMGLSPHTHAERLDISDRIRAALEAFEREITDDRERSIWEQRIVADEPMSLQELGDAFEVSRERIRQIEKGLKDRFKAFWVERIGEEEAALIFEE